MLETQTALPVRGASDGHERSRPTTHAHPTNVSLGTAESTSERESVNQGGYEHNRSLSSEAQLDSKPARQKHAVAEDKADGDRPRSQSSVATLKLKKAHGRSAIQNDTTARANLPQQPGRPSPVGDLSVGPVKSPAQQSMAQQCSSTPVKAAYAGPTFHASPAPSSLPVPRFFSRSLPASEMFSSLGPMSNADPTGTKSPPAAPKAALPSPTPAATPSRSPVAVPPLSHEESPLDLFFRADKEEKARTLSQNLAQAKQESTNLRTLTSKSSPTSGERVARANRRRPHSRHPSDSSGKDMFMMELDGAIQPEPASPAYDSIRKGRQKGPQQLGGPSEPPRSGLDEEQRMAKTEALKKLLLSPNSESSPSSPKWSPVESVLQDDSSNSSARPHIGSRSVSGPNTPVQSLPTSREESSGLHYGNRDLSPLFQKVSTKSKPDIKRTGSGLRHNFVPPSSPKDRDVETRSTPTPSFSAGNAQSAKFDVSSFSRDYLNSHLRGTVSNLNPHRHSVSSLAIASSHVDPTPPHPSKQSKTVQSMEEDLRRILNMHVPGDKNVSGTAGQDVVSRNS